MDHAVFGSRSQTVTVLRCMKMMIFTLGLNVHSSACKFNDFVMNNPDNCSFNHFFFSSILLPSALLSLAIVGFIQVNTVEEGNTEHLSAFNIILKILRNIFSGIFFHRRSNE